jgi:cholesterol transport system auxiliary component
MNKLLPRPAMRVARPRRRHATFGVLLAAGTTLLMACTGALLPKPAPPPARYTLELGESGPAARPAAAGAPVLTVDLPRAAPGYDSRRMVYLRRPHELEAFAFHEWVATPAQMLMPLVVRALQDSGAFRVVLSAPTAAEASWRLQTESLRLHQDFTERPSRVRLSVRGVLLDGATRQALAWREFDISVNAAGDDPVSGAVAAQAAAEQLGVAMAVFCAEQVQGAAQRLR